MTADAPVPDQPIRFAAGSPTGPRSTVWRIWAERDSSVYVAARAIAGRFKASLHASGDWRVSFRLLEDARLVIPGATGRIVKRFAPSKEIAPRVRRGFSLFIPWFAVSLPPLDGVESGPVVWLEAPDDGYCIEASLIFTDEAGATFAPADNRASSRVIGTLNLPNGGTVSVVCRTRPVLPKEAAAWAATRRKHRRRGRTDAPDARLLDAGSGIEDGSWWFLDLGPLEE